MKISMTLGRHDKGSIKLKNFGNALPANLKRGFARSGILLASQIKRFITGPSVTIDRSRRFVGSVTGRLRGSVTFEVLSSFKTIGLRVGPNVEYAAIHEFGGTIHQVVTAKQRMFLGLNKGIWLKVGHRLTIKIPARPYVWPAWIKKKREVFILLQNAIYKPLRKR